MCSVNSVTYQAKCENCDNEGKVRTYDGETARTAYIRSKEHYDDLKNKKSTSWMWKHILKDHAGNAENVNFSWRVNRKLRKPLQRQLFEAVKISRKSPQENLNTKCEFNGQRLRKFETHTDRIYDCHVCGQLFDDMKKVKDHNRMFHMKITCDQCFAIHFGETGLKEHFKNSHQVNVQ